jgi:hypothetical protein
LDQSAQAVIADALNQDDEARWPRGWKQGGVTLQGMELVLSGTGTTGPTQVWADDLPVFEPPDPDEDDFGFKWDKPKREMPTDSNEAVKRLVMNNISSDSVLLELLANPKVVAIPGLIEEVVNRCRSLQVLETIASNRAFYCGYANKGVPWALLTSPCNISVKTLRKFIHVKYVAKVDLQHLARDKASYRDEVIKEVKYYLRSLNQ